MGLVRLGTVVLTADPSPGNVLKLLREYAVEHTFIVPTVIRAIVDALGPLDASDLKLRGLYYGAMPMGEGLLREALQKFNCRFVHFFGMTEITGSATLLGPAAHDLARPELLKSIGKPYPGMQIEIRGPDRRVLGRGEHGEIWIRSPTLMLGYSKQPERTREVVVDGWYATGDGAYIDDEGWLFLTDRIKDMIVSGGENVYPAEVEEALRGHAAVLDAAVVALPDPHWGEAVAALVQLRPDQSVSDEELQQFTRGRIAAFKCPRRVFFAAALPRTAAGKVQRVEVRRLLRERAGIVS
jgi:acyl-CoA synthetase (AMP-forming)/AMP-acid ligase II